jgi:hypothetical protein
MGLDSKGRIASFSILLAGAAPIDFPKSYLAAYSVNSDYIIIPPKGTLASSTDVKIDMSTRFESVLNAAQPTYIDTPLDPYPLVRWGVTNAFSTQLHSFDLKSSIGDDSWNGMWESFKLVPRNIFEKMACDVLSTITDNPTLRNKSGEDILKIIKFHDFIRLEFQVFMMASNLIDIFIRSNIEAMGIAGIKDPNQWESLKSVSYASKDENQSIADLEALLKTADPASAMFINDMLLSKKFVLRVTNLPQAKDPVLNVQRGVTLSGMISRKEWNQLNLICSIYENMDQSMKDIVAQI